MEEDREIQVDLDGGTGRRLPRWLKICLWVLTGLVLLALVFVACRASTVWVRGYQQPAPVIRETVVVQQTVEVEVPVEQTVVVQQTVVVEREVEIEVEVIVTATPSPAPIVEPTATPAPTATPTSAQQESELPQVSCRDGEVIGNERNLLDRTPVGLGENNSVVEVSWQPGSGFGGFDRFVLVIPALQGQYQVFLVSVSTIHMVRYCGSIDQVEAYVGQEVTHIMAMRVTAADQSGNLPDLQEIGAYRLDLASGKVSVLNEAPKGPTISTIEAHVEVVPLGGQSGLASSEPLTTTGAAAACVPTTIDLGPWEAKDRTVVGPAIVNIGFPDEGTTQVRVFVPSGETVVFKNAAGSGWDFTVCGEAQAKAELTEFAGDLPVVTVQSLVDAGKAKWQ